MTLPYVPPTASHPCSLHFDSTLPPAVAFTERLTDPVGQWHDQWVGGTFSDTEREGQGAKGLGSE